MTRKKSMAVPEGNSPIPQNAYVMVHGITLEDFRRIMSEAMDKTSTNTSDRSQKTQMR